MSAGPKGFHPRGRLYRAWLMLGLSDATAIAVSTHTALAAAQLAALNAKLAVLDGLIAKL